MRTAGAFPGVHQKAWGQSRSALLDGSLMAKWMPTSAGQGRLCLSVEALKGFLVMAWRWRGVAASGVSHGCDGGASSSRVITEGQPSHRAVT
jgi:hypothetical protein